MQPALYSLAPHTHLTLEVAGASQLCILSQRWLCFSSNETARHIVPHSSLQHPRSPSENNADKVKKIIWRWPKAVLPSFYYRIILKVLLCFPQIISRPPPYPPLIPLNFLTRFVSIFLLIFHQRGSSTFSCSSQEPWHYQMAHCVSDEQTELSPAKHRSLK